jgi:GTP-binding protein
MKTRYQAARFVLSAHRLSQLPPDEGREVAFAGRSNAGKSSALNAITSQRTLARISKTPGRTQMLNFFEIEPGRHLVDLPGYGYAKVPDSVRRQWQATLQRYLNKRRSLSGLFLLMDIRHPLTDLDNQLLEWSRHQGPHCHVLLTKSDKLKRGPALGVRQRVQAELESRGCRANVQLFSAVQRVGLEEVFSKLNEWLGYSDAPMGSANGESKP